MAFQQNAFQQNALQVGFAPGVSPAPFTPTIGQIPLLERNDRFQGGYSTVPNLLITTLALFAAASQQRSPIEFRPQQSLAVQIFQPPNLLTSTLASQLVAIPPGEQATQSAPSLVQSFSQNQAGNGLLMPAQVIASAQQIASAPPNQTQNQAQENQSRALYDLVVNPIPVGRQQVDSAPPTPRILFWDKGTNTLLFITHPAGKQQLDSAPSSIQTTVAPTGSNFQLLNPQAAPLPIGAQETSNLVQPSAVKVDQPQNVLLQLPPPAIQQLPPGEQRTESAPVAIQRLNVDQTGNVVLTFPPPPAGALPIGEQRTESAPSTIFRPLIDEPQNLLAGPLGLPPVASSQSEFMFSIWTPPVELWAAPNVTINLPVSAQAIPVGEQWIASAPIWTPPVQNYEALNLVTLTQFAIPPGKQRTESALSWASPVQSYEAPNAALFIPPPNPLPIGDQQTSSAPTRVIHVWAQNSAIPPNLLPPPPIPVGHNIIKAGIWSPGNTIYAGVRNG